MDEGKEGPEPTAEDVDKAFERVNRIIKEKTGKDPEEFLSNTGVKPLPGTMGLKFVHERFTIPPKDTGASSEAVEERIKEVANTPPGELSASSQWRRDLLASQQVNKQAPPAPDQGKTSK